MGGSSPCPVCGRDWFDHALDEQEACLEEARIKARVHKKKSGRSDMSKNLEEAMRVLGITPEDAKQMGLSEGAIKAKATLKEKKKASSRSQSKPPVPKVEADPNIWLVQHVYLREGEPEGLIHTNARRLAMQGGPGTAVYKHMHAAHAPCSESCSYKVVE